MAPWSKIFPTLLFLTSACYISGLVSLVSGSCEADFNSCSQTSYPWTDIWVLEVILYFDGGVDTDIPYIEAMCKARSLMKYVKFTFIPGVLVKESSTGKLECPTGDCTYSLIDACALTLAPDFTEFVCVEYDDDIKTMDDVYNKLNLDADKFGKCTKLMDPDIKPIDTLLQNARMAIAAHSNDKCTPYISFNGESDACARAIFVQDPAKVICGMLASGLEEECTKYA